MRKSKHLILTFILYALVISGGFSQPARPVEKKALREFKDYGFSILESEGWKYLFVETPIPELKIHRWQHNSGTKIVEVGVGADLLHVTTPYLKLLYLKNGHPEIQSLKLIYEGVNPIGDEWTWKSELTGIMKNHGKVSVYIVIYKKRRTYFVSSIFPENEKITADALKMLNSVIFH